MTKKNRGKRDKARASARRRERRFIPVSSTNKGVIALCGALGAMLLGAGLYAYFYGGSFADDEKVQQIPSYLVAAGAILTGVTIWIGTSGEPPVRVGDPGVAIEKGEVRRMPWWAVQRIGWDDASEALRVDGADEGGREWTLRVAVRSHPEAAAWLLKEADARIPKKVDVGDAVRDRLVAREHAGTVLELEALQVVGKKCAATGKAISYEPDARVCARCERVYLKRSVPRRCTGGANLQHLRPGAVADATEDEDEDEQDDADALEGEGAQSDEPISTRARATEDAES